MLWSLRSPARSDLLWDPHHHRYERDNSIRRRVVVVPAEQHVTVLIHLSSGGTPTITDFSNSKLVPPVGQSRVVFRNTADAPPIDVYLDGVKVVSASADNSNSPGSVSVLVNAGSIGT